jgi:hypothetical protein
MKRATRTRLLLAAGLPTAYVTLMALVAAVWVKPPLLGWVGFAIVAAVGAGLIFAAFMLLPRSRTNVAAVPETGRRDGVLVVVDATCAPGQLAERIIHHLHGRNAEVHVVAPVLPEPISYVTSDEVRDRADAQRRLDETLEGLRVAGVEATGAIGTDDPLQAIGDAQATFPARELVIVTGTESRWLEEGLLDRARQLADSVEQITVASRTSVA